MEQQNDYQFVMIPQKLASCLDANCQKMLTVLIGLDSILSKEDGWFYRSNKDLQLDTRFSQNLVIATLDTLYQAGLLNIDSIGKGRGHRTNRIHINFEGFKRYERYSFNDIRNNPDLWINTVSYKNHYSPSYCKEIGNSLGNRIGKKVTTITDTTDTSYTTDTIENNIIKEDKYKNLTWEEYLQLFINKHTSFNYSLKFSIFTMTYRDTLEAYQKFLYEKTGFEYPIEVLTYHLTYYATFGKVFQETAIINKQI